ncbi:MAG TPA: YciI family protein [Acidimicrobiales bacterium]|nr:YciI family protein [Acidimicrobiales bacterium]
MQFALFIYQGTTPLPNTDAWEALPAAEQKKIYADYAALNSNDAVSPGLPLGLPSDAKTVQVVNGKAVPKDGPFLGAEGAVGGYLVLEVEDEAAAIALAATIPAARHGGAVEIRPVATYW